MQLSEIRQMARRIIEEYNPDGLVPFPFEVVTEGLGDVDLLFLDGMPQNISGAIFFQEQDGGKFIITVNRQEPATRQYFTTAHEFGHYFIHKDWLRTNASNTFVDYEEVLDIDGMLLRPDRAPLDAAMLLKEKEANNFAAELVMPEDKVREFWDLTHDLIRCAKAFQVSQSAMAIRLDRLDLVP